VSARKLAVVLLGVIGCAWLGCATGAPRGSLTSGFGLHSRPASVRSSSGPRQRAAPVSAEAVGSGGSFPAQRPDVATEPFLVIIEEMVEAPAPSICGGQPLPPGWPDVSSIDAEALLAPFLACTPAEFV
jgi:hypothetical protein